jgi:hypothetical protein
MDPIDIFKYAAALSVSMVIISIAIGTCILLIAMAKDLSK